MQQHKLPTWNELIQHVLEELDNARRNMSAARDSVNSDWRPLGSPLTDAAADARTTIFQLIGTIKGQIDQAKSLLTGSETGNGKHH